MTKKVESRRKGSRKNKEIEKVQAPRRSGSRSNVKKFSIKLNETIVKEFDKIKPNRTSAIEELMIEEILYDADQKGVLHRFRNMDAIDI